MRLQSQFIIKRDKSGIGEIRNRHLEKSIQQWEDKMEQMGRGDGSDFKYRIWGWEYECVSTGVSVHGRKWWRLMSLGISGGLYKLRQVVVGGFGPEDLCQGCFGRF